LIQTRPIPTALLCCVVLLACGGEPPAGDTPAKPVVSDVAEKSVPAEERRLEFESYVAVLDLFEELRYTPEVWQAGIREVPRVFITDVPERWRKETTQQIDVQLKKRLFFRALAPLVLRANEMILADRERVERLAAGRDEGSTLSSEDERWLTEVALRYDIIDSDEEAVDTADLEDILARVDIVPASLALSQGAEESGWGTSRFASQGNALFGQWTWGENAIKPDQQREKLGNYGIAAFETPLQSVLAYMHNLNTHRAYAGLREKRAKTRSENEPLSGHALAETLDRYSERGVEYVKSLQAIMRVNHLDAADSAYLANGPTIWLVPVEAAP
jgi:Bax protein